MIALCEPTASPKTIAANVSARLTAAPAINGGGRSLELDMIRGMALFVMLSNHLLGNPWSMLTSRPLGLFSGADVFVFTSGVAAGLKYHRSYASGGMAKVWTGILRSWVILLVTCAIVRTWSNLSGILYPYLVLWGLIGVLAPACARGWRNVVLALSLVGWLAAFVTPLPGPFDKWVFNPLSWQLLFCLGFTFGQRKASGAGPLPRRETLLVLFAPLAVAFFLLRHSLANTSGWLFSGSPWVGPLRLLDFLAVAYLCYHLVHMPRRLAKPFASLGRHGLWIFVWVTVLVAAWEFWKLPAGSPFLRMTAAAGALASLWLAVPVVQAVKSQVRKNRSKLRSVVSIESVEATA